MHTSEHANSPVLAYTGTLIHQAEARTKVLDSDCHSVPVLCMDIELDNSMHTAMHVEQPFPAEHFKQCEAAARRLKTGTRVTVEAPLMDTRLVARNATHIHVIPELETDLFQERAA